MSTVLINETQAALFQFTNVLGDAPMINYTAYYTRLINNLIPLFVMGISVFV